jgi:hypothetical protein
MLVAGGDLVWRQGTRILSQDLGQDFGRVSYRSSFHTRVSP